MKQATLILVVNLIVLIKGGLNPCPDVIKFYTNTRDYGIITIPPPGKGLIILKVQIGVRDPTESINALLSLRKSLEDTVADAERGQDIQYILNFPQSRLRHQPYIEKINLNNRDICNGPEIPNIHKYRSEHKIQNPEGSTQLANIPHRQPTASTPQPGYQYRPPSYTNPINPINPDPEGNPWLPNRHRVTPTLPHSPPSRPTPATVSDGSWVGSLPLTGTCGRAAPFLQGLIIGGTPVDRGEFPWMVAMFHFEDGSTEFKCGASLISNTYVISAAHCTKNQKIVHLEFGRHNIIDRYETSFLCRNSTNIIEHPEHVSGANNDVALISFNRVEFSSEIKPICLWAQGINLDNILVTGTVTGWGRRDNDDTKSTTPIKVNVTRVTLDTCRNSHVSLRNIVTPKTFCAGGRSSGPCKGDSGGGFYVVHRNVWYLRGVVSHSLGTDWTCNVDAYAVYTDLAYFLDWMRPYLVS